MRKFNRKNHESRKISIEVGINKNADGSCIICYGMTKVICTASIDEEIAKWLPDDTIFVRAFGDISIKYKVYSSPPGAEVYVGVYGEDVDQFMRVLKVCNDTLPIELIKYDSITS